MKIKHLLLVFVILVIALGVSACRMPASTPPPATPTTAEGFPVPGTQTMGLFETIATQTAMAAEAGGGVVQETPAPPPETVEEPTEAAPAQPEEPQPAQPAAPTEASPAVVEVPEPTPGLPATHTLQKGEYPYCIARRFNVNPADLLSINSLNVNSTTQPGLVLNIPQNGRTFPGTRALRSHPTTYTVRSGDTIYSIACQFGDVDPLVIAQVNNLSSPYTLSSGQNLQIP